MMHLTESEALGFFRTAGMRTLVMDQAPNEVPPPEDDPADLDDEPDESDGDFGAEPEDETDFTEEPPPDPNNPHPGMDRPAERLPDKGA
jgi:hypothetical protein